MGERPDPVPGPVPPPARLRAGQPAARAPPPRRILCRTHRGARPPTLQRRPGRGPVGALEQLPAPRARRGVVAPGTAGRDPHPRPGARRRPHRQRVVGVGHHRDRGIRGQDLPDTGRGGPHLRHPVKLIAREVQQHDHRRRHRARHLAQVQLVDLQHRPPRTRARRQRGHRPIRHVRPARVVRHRTALPQSRRQQMTGRRLAVGTRDQHHGATPRQPRQHPRIQSQRQPPHDDRPTTAPHQPRQPPRHPTRSHRQVRPPPTTTHSRWRLPQPPQPPRTPPRQASPPPTPPQHPARSARRHAPTGPPGHVPVTTDSQAHSSSLRPQQRPTGPRTTASAAGDECQSGQPRVGRSSRAAPCQNGTAAR